jgi:hypothetical protein
MKAPKFLMASLLALSTASLAPAQTTTLHLTGSTAFRTAAQQAILDMLQPGYQVGFTGSSYLGAGAAIIEGTTKSNINGAPISVVIQTYWSGSLAGIQTVSSGLGIANSFLSVSNSLTGGTSTPIASPVFDASDVPDACMADGFQYDSQYPTPMLNAQSVGVVDFVFVRNKPAPTTISNMTPLLAQALWPAGQLQLSMFSGNSNDVTTNVYATGRNPDSGTRKTAFLETGIQQFVANLDPQLVYQWAPSNSGGLVTAKNPGAITSQGYFPQAVVDGITFGAGDGGYSSGGDLATAMGQSSPYIYVAYLGLSDAATAIGLGAVELNYNGVPFSHTAVQNGQYTYWAYEQLDYLTSYISTELNVQPLADLLAQTIATENLTGVGESLTSMNVSRPQEGQPVTP